MEEYGTASGNAGLKKKSTLSSAVKKRVVLFEKVIEKRPRRTMEPGIGEGVDTLLTNGIKS